MDQYMEIISAPDAWQIADDDPNDEDEGIDKEPWAETAPPGLRYPLRLYTSLHGIANRLSTCLI